MATLQAQTSQLHNISIQQNAACTPEYIQIKKFKNNKEK